MTDIEMIEKELIPLLNKEFDNARELVTQYEGTPHHYKFSHKMMAIRDLIKKIKKLLNEHRHTS